jgi:hypothetical protein
MIRFFSLLATLLTAYALSAAVVWENNLPAALTMYNRSGLAADPVIEDDAMAFATKKGMAIFERKNVEFTADHSSLELLIKAPASCRYINIYYTTDSDSKYA